MKKKIGLLALASMALLVPSCGKRLLRKVAAQLVSTYQYFDPKPQDTKDMVKEVNMRWDYSGTDEGAIETVQEMIGFLTGEEKADKIGSIVLAKEKYDAFFEIGEAYGHENYKNFANDLIRWNLCSLANIVIPGDDEPTPFPVFDIYFPEEINCKYESKVNDLFVSGPLLVEKDEENEKINVGNGFYHYDSYGRLVDGSFDFNANDADLGGKVHFSFGVNASYNPIKK